MKEWYDAIVIGGGPAGSTAAWHLARAGWRVALVERSVFPRRKVCGEFVSAANGALFRDMGIADAFGELAGPVVRQVGLFTADAALETEMQLAVEGTRGWGQALSREYLDLLLLDAAVAAGAQVFQPWTAVSLTGVPGGHRCRLISKTHSENQELLARTVVAAHGSWDNHGLHTQPVRSRPRGSDLMAFKTHFRETRMSAALMPLLVFAGGYGGMVQTDHDRLSVSFCITRRQLDRCRAALPGLPAAEVVLAYVKSRCGRLCEILEGASQEGSWLAVGPIRPGIRRCTAGLGIFRVGNAAGEAHPAIAEGITMALQSGAMLGRLLAGRESVLTEPRALAEAGIEYSQQWRRYFPRRIYVSAGIAQWAMHPMLTALLMPLLKWWPKGLAIGAKASGKAPLPVPLVAE